jgi:transketolase
VAWRDAIERRDGPTSLVLSRQNLPADSRSAEPLQSIRRGGYILRGEGPADVILIASGSEVSLAMAAAELITARGHAVRVVSLPCMQLFASQPAAYRESVLPAAVTCRVAIEAGVPHLWHALVGSSGSVVGISRFGESAPAKELFTHFGFTPQNVANVALELLGH